MDLQPSRDPRSKATLSLVPGASSPLLLLLLLLHSIAAEEGRTAEEDRNAEAAGCRTAEVGKRGTAGTGEGEDGVEVRSAADRAVHIAEEGDRSCEEVQGRSWGQGMRGRVGSWEEAVEVGTGVEGMTGDGKDEGGRNWRWTDELVQGGVEEQRWARRWGLRREERREGVGKTTLSVEEEGPCDGREGSDPRVPSQPSTRSSCS
jgi:hypothetical protein